MAYEDELYTLAFPVRWDASEWEAVRSSPENSIRLLAEAAGRVDARLAGQIPDFDTRSALIVVDGVAAIDELRKAIGDVPDSGLHWLSWNQWLAAPQPGTGILRVASDFVIVPSIEAVPQIWGAAEPRTYTCDDCRQTLPSPGHAPDCPWK